MPPESFKERTTKEKTIATLRHLAPSLKWIIILSLSIAFGAMISVPVSAGYINYYKENSALFSNTSAESNGEDCNVLGINLHGFLDTYNSDGSEPSDNYDTTSENITQKIKDANEDEDLKAIIIEVDSNGGIPVAGEEIANAIKNSKKPVVAFIRSAGLSSAYWAISSANKIFASKISDVGSIGVTLSYLSSAEKNKKDGYKFEEINSGKYKDTGTPDKALTADERVILQKGINIMYNNFVGTVSENRKIPLDKVKALADGSSVLGEEAKQAGLIDEIGGIDEVEKYLADVVGEEVKVCW